MSASEHPETAAPDLAQLLEAIEPYAVRFPPADARALAEAEAGLKQLGAGPIPGDYAALLRQSNGLFWNGIYLYGTRPIPRPHRNYTLASLAQATAEAKGQGLPPDGLVIGNTEDERLIYRTHSRRYEQVTRLHGEVERSAAQFTQLLAILLKERGAPLPSHSKH